MLEEWGNTLIAVFTGVVSLAIISTIISKKSQTPQVLQAASSALANVIAATVAPVNTSSTNGNLGVNPFSQPGL